MSVIRVSGIKMYIITYFLLSFFFQKRIKNFTNKKNTQKESRDTHTQLHGKNFSPTNMPIFIRKKEEKKLSLSIYLRVNFPSIRHMCV